MLFAIAAALSVLVALVWYLSGRQRPGQIAAVTPAPAGVSTPVAPAALPTSTPTATPSTGTDPLADPAPQPSATQTESAPQPSASASPAPSSAAAPGGSKALLVPVAGVRADQLRDTFQDARSEGRVHDAIDIPAPRGTPVLAVTDGRIVKLFQSQRGGTTVYQLDNDNRTVYYYAHLERYADGLAEGRFAHRGETIGYVGDTGNAGPGNYHLHFSVLIVADPKRYWDGTNINPYPLLRGGK